MIELCKMEKCLKEASTHLKQAGTLLRLAEIEVKPFLVSKCINVMGKTTLDDAVLLEIMLGNLKPEEVFFEFRTHARKIFMRYLEEVKEK